MAHIMTRRISPTQFFWSSLAWLGITAFAIALALAGCSTLQAGTIVDKRFTAAHTTTVLIPQYITTCSGNPVVCRQQLTYFLPVTTDHPDLWEFHLEQCDFENNCEDRWMAVTQDEYDSYAEGAFYEVQE